MPRFNKRTDANQQSIVDVLRKAGVQVVITNFGQDFPDLLCGHLGFWTLVEVKESDGSLDRGQMEFIASAKGAVAVVTNAEECLDALSGTPISRRQKEKLAGWLIKFSLQQSLSVRKFRKVIEV